MNEDLVGIDAMVQLFAKRERYRRGDWKRHAAPDAGSEPAEEPELGAEIRLVIVPKEPLRISADRKSTRLNSSHLVISYAVFCLKKKKKPEYNEQNTK